MKRNQPFLLLVTVAILVIAFSSFSPDDKNPFPGYKQIENGTYILLHKKGAGTTAADTGGAVFATIKFKTADDSVFMDINQMTHNASYPMRVDKSEFKGDFLDVFMRLHQGDSASFFIRLDSLKVHYPDEFKFPGMRHDTMQYLGFAVRIDSIYSKEKVTLLRAAADAERQKQEETNEKIKEAEPAAIRKYIADNKIGEKPTPSGLYYIERTKGKGKNIEDGQLVKVRYAGRFLDGAEFDSNMKPGENLFEFVVGSNEVIPGFNEGIKRMKKGGKATLIMPSTLAYNDGARRFRPYATLIFEIELVEVWDQK